MRMTANSRWRPSPGLVVVVGPVTGGIRGSKTGESVAVCVGLMISCWDISEKVTAISVYCRWSNLMNRRIQTSPDVRSSSKCGCTSLPVNRLSRLVQVPNLETRMRLTNKLLLSYLLLTVVLTSGVGGQQPELTYKVREEQEIGTYVGNVARESQIYTHFNQSEFQSLEYTIPTTVSKFSIDRKTSTIKTARVLDREAECDGQNGGACVNNFDVSVVRVNKDGGYSLLRIIKVNIVIEDINDNAPEFPSNETVLDIPESSEVGQIVVTSGAYDRDSGDNNTVQKYTLEGGAGIFDLKVIPVTGSRDSDLGIVLKQKLDRENVASYRLKIIAEDGGFPKLSGSMNILIRVTDVNDNSPAFSRGSFNASVPEDEPEKFTVLTLSASDPDEGENARLTYAFSVPASPKVTEYFAINEASGEVSLVKPLDYERDKAFRFSVTVSDNGSPSRSSQAVVQIFVEDVNDNAPQIEITLPSAYVKESIGVGNYIAHVSLSDPDSGVNSFISCVIPNEHFMLQRFAGSDSIYTVILKSHLDYEKSQREVVNVTCQDGGRPPLQNSSSFVVYVQDVNDNAPIFTRNTYRVDVDEENYVGQFVTQIQAVDPDDGDNGNVSYSLVVNPDGKFQINPISGVVKATRTLDREEIPSYELVVQARDKGAPPLSSTVTVTVLLNDINDNPPKFTRQHFEMRVQENQAKNTVVDKVSAADPDTQSDNHLRFQFAPNFTEIGAFGIDRMSGTIYTLAPLDRESKDKYAFDVMVLDESKSTYLDYAKVTVFVTDDNDNRPVITYPDETNNTFYIMYTYPAGSILLRLEYKDLDMGENATVKFTLPQGNEKGLFYMNAINGELVLAKRLGINDAGIYKLTVLVRDNGLSYLESKRDINIIVTVSNGTSGFYEEDGPGANIAIVIALVCITGVLALAVLITICIIRRIDHERKQHVAAKVDEDNMYKQHTLPDGLMSTPGKETFENEIDKLKRKIKRDLSFGVEEDSGPLDSSDQTSKSSTFSTFKSTTPGSTDQKNVSTPQTHASVLHNTLSPTEGNVKRVHYMDKGLDIDRLTTSSPPRAPLTSSMAYHSVRGGHWPAGRSQSPRSSVVKLAQDDVTSHSSGSTCDSGRGGSSEEGEGHGPAHAVVVAIGDGDRRDSAANQPLATAKVMTFSSSKSPSSSTATTTVDSSGSTAMPRSTSTSLNSETARKRLWGDSSSSLSTTTASATTLSARLDNDSLGQAFGMSEVSGCYRPNISFSDDSVTANTMVGNGSDVGQDSRQLHEQSRRVEKPSMGKHGFGASSGDHTPKPTASHNSNQQRATPYFNNSGTPYRLLTANLSRIPNDDASTTHGQYIEGASLSIFEPGNSGGRPRSYMNAHSNLRNTGGNSSCSYTKPSNCVTDIGNSYINLANARGRSLVSPISLGNSESKILAMDDGYSLHDIDEVLEDAVTVQDDDNTTTTSGSYTINAEDLCQEINQLFFNDIVV